MSTLILLQPNDVCVVQLERLCLGSRAIIGVHTCFISYKFTFSLNFQVSASDEVCQRQKSEKKRLEVALLRYIANFNDRSRNRKKNIVCI